MNLSRKGSIWSAPITNESGSVLVAALLLSVVLLVLLASLFFLSESITSQIATQSRLDICAEELTANRKALYQKLVRSNKVLSATKYGIYAIRGAMLLGPISAAVSGTGQVALLRINKLAQLYQKAQIWRAQATEVRKGLCRPMFRSSIRSVCIVTPPIAKALEREDTLFADVYGTIEQKKLADQSLAKVHCQAWNFSKTTQMKIDGDQELSENNFKEFYAK